MKYLFILGALGVACVLAVSPSASAATITNATVVIGGPGSLSSEGTSNPGLLSDGTQPGAHVDLTYDSDTAMLTLDIFNDGPSGSLTGLFFNVPSGVTGASLATAGATYVGLIFDLNDLGADGFGRFDFYVGNSTSSSPNGGSPGSILVGNNETVIIAFAGSSIGSIVASDFLDGLSEIPPGSAPQHVVGRFQSGTEGGSGFITDGDVPEPATLAYVVSAMALGAITLARKRK